MRRAPRRPPSDLAMMAAFNAARAPSPPSGGEGRGEGVSPRVVRLWRHPSPRPSPRKSGERERRHRADGIAALVLAAILCSPAHAQDSVEAFYQGRQINLVVGYGPGGGYDLTARLLARHMGRFIPGTPSVVVQNMPGAGSLRTANWLFGAAPKDGGAVGLFGSDIP